LRISMRKSIKSSDTELAPEKASWLDVSAMARVEVTSEDSQYPIESASAEGDQRGWRAAERGKQTIRLFFDEPQRIRRIWLRFIELHGERTQQFSLQWSKDKTDPLRPVARIGIMIGKMRTSGRRERTAIEKLHSAKKNEHHQNLDYFFTPRTASFAALATRNLTTVLAGILIFCCVLGLKPV